MADQFQRIKLIDQETKDLVFGFVKHNLHSRFSIPSLIQYTIVLYYHIEEYFTKIGSCMKLNKQNDTVNMRGDFEDELRANTVYGNIEINNINFTKYIWIFKILKMNKDSFICIGMDSSNKQCIEYDFYVSTDHSYYAYEIGTDSSCKTNDIDGADAYGLCGNEGDIIKMELNISNNLLKFCHNHKDLGIAFDDIDFSDGKVYHMATFLTNASTCIQLIHFQRT
eukprot:94772_1